MLEGITGSIWAELPTGALAGPGTIAVQSLQDWTLSYQVKHCEPRELSCVYKQVDRVREEQAGMGVRGAEHHSR